VCPALLDNGQSDARTEGARRRADREPRRGARTSLSPNERAVLPDRRLPTVPEDRRRDADEELRRAGEARPRRGTRAGALAPEVTGGAARTGARIEEAARIIAHSRSAPRLDACESWRSGARRHRTDAGSLRVVAERLTDYVLADAAVLSLASPFRRGAATLRGGTHGTARASRRIALHDACDAPAGGRGARAGRARREANAAVVRRRLPHACSTARASARTSVMRCAARLWRRARRAPRRSCRNRQVPRARRGARSMDRGRLRSDRARALAMAASYCVTSGLRSDTLAKFLFDTERGRSTFLLDHRSVVLLDEPAWRAPTTSRSCSISWRSVKGRCPRRRPAPARQPPHVRRTVAGVPEVH